LVRALRGRSARGDPGIDAEGRDITMKPGRRLVGASVVLSFFSAAICAEQTDTCAGLEGTILTQCRSNQQTLRQQEHLEQLLQQQQERQNELDQQQREVQQQLESMRLQNESLRKQLEREIASQPARPGATTSSNSSKSADLKSWKADNPWFGSDYARTQFATRYIKQLEKERPDLAGRELLDAVSTKVNETFAARH
jgi:TolA-binding protein